MNPLVILDKIKNAKGALSYVPACAVDTESYKHVCDAYNELADLQDYIKRASEIND